MTPRRWFGLRAGAANWLWLAAAVMLLDQWTKSLITDNLAEFEEYILLPVLEFMRLHNEGAAFSMLSAAGGWQRWVFIALGLAVSVGILIWLRRMPGQGQNLLAAGLSLILGGALGNVTDRVLWGHVIDFIRVHYQQYYFPAFNVADSAITIGAACYDILTLIIRQDARFFNKKCLKNLEEGTTGSCARQRPGCSSSLRAATRLPVAPSARGRPAWC